MSPNVDHKHKTFCTNSVIPENYNLRNHLHNDHSCAHAFLLCVLVNQ